MISSAWGDIRRTVDSALESLDGAVVRDSQDSWKLNALGVPESVSLDLADEWLAFQVPCRPVPDGSPEDLCRRLLELNSSSCGTARYAWLEPGSPTLRAEAPLLADTDLQSWIRTNLAGFSHLLGCGQSLDGTPSLNCREPEENPLPVENLSDILAEAGWVSKKSADSALSVELEVAGQVRRAQLGVSPTGSVQASTTLVESRSISEPSRHALAVFLLGCNSTFRMVRCGAHDAEDQGLICTAVVGFAGFPTQEEISCGLEALTIVCLHSGCEAEALLDPEVASDYLEMWRPEVSLEGSPQEIECPNENRANTKE